MGRYIDWTLVANRYPDAAKITGAEVVNSAWLFGAEAEIDARLAPRYTVPFSPAPDLVKDLCADLLYAKMTSRQEGSKIIYDRVLATIKEIIAGTLTIPGALPSAEGIISTASNSYRSAFGVDDPVNWSRSQSQIDDTQRERDWD